MGFTPLNPENNIYQRKEPEIIVALYVDDYLIVHPSQDDIKILTLNHNEEIPLNYFGELIWFPGVRIRTPSSTGCILLDQSQYLVRSFQEFGMSSNRRVETSMSPESKKDISKSNGKAIVNELYQFQRLVGKHNFPSWILRCDTAQETSKMARFMCNPSLLH